MASTPPRAGKRRLQDMVKTALFCGSCFAICLLGTTGTFAFRDRITLLNRVTDLARDLSSLDRLKKEFVDDELEIRWDQQHIRELEDNIESMRGGFHRLTQTFNEEESYLVRKNESLGEALTRTSEFGANARDLDREAHAELAREAERARGGLIDEAADSVRLRRLIAETVAEMDEDDIPVPPIAQAALRGSSLRLW